MKRWFRERSLRSLAVVTAALVVAVQSGATASAFVYKHPSRHVSIDIRDNKNPEYCLTHQEKGQIADILSKLPAQHLKGIEWIETRPYQYDGWFSLSNAHGIILFVMPLDQRGKNALPFHVIIPLEVGHHVYRCVLTHNERKEWDTLYGPWPSPGMGFARVYQFWTNYLDYDLRVAVREAARGKTSALERVLFVASLFSDTRDHKVNFYSLDFRGEPKMVVRQKGMFRDAGSLWIGIYKFFISRNRITAVQRGETAPLQLQGFIPVPRTLLSHTPKALFSEIRPSQPVIALRPTR